MKQNTWSQRIENGGAITVAIILFFCLLVLIYQNFWEAVSVILGFTLVFVTFAVVGFVSEKARDIIRKIRKKGE